MEMGKMEMEKREVLKKRVSVVFYGFQGSKFEILNYSVSGLYGKIKDRREQYDFDIDISTEQRKLISIDIDGLDFIVVITDGKFRIKNGDREVFVWVR